MVTRTRWACKPLGLALLVLACARKTPVPTLEVALKTPGGPAGKAKACLEVALAGPAGERQEAAMLWGLYACDAGAPAAALRAFSLAKPEGARAVVAARRLEEAVSRRPPSPPFFAQLAAASWLAPEAKERILLAAVEATLRIGDGRAAGAVLPPAEVFSAKTRPRARALRAQLFPEESQRQKQELLLESPQDFRRLLPSEAWENVAAGFTPNQWGKLAEGLLAAGDAASALRAAQRAGHATVAAKAALALRRSEEAQRWAERLPGGSAERFLLLAQALRQQAWRADGQARVSVFARVAATAREAERRASGAQRAEAQLLLAEALLEQGQLAEVPRLLAASASGKPARWEWVARRALMAFALRGTVLTLPEEAAGPRLSRLAQFWSGWVELRRKNPRLLEQLAASGHPDLPAQWAARLAGKALRWSLGEASLVPPEPPPWARWWLTAGRVADVILGWRTELEAENAAGGAWLGLLQLADYPPLEAIPILVRAEPRLFSGPWSGVSRELLARYLPLPYRSQLEGAARAQGLPPWVLAAVVRQESAFNPRARSAKGAVGLAQLLPETAGLSASALEEPEVNLNAGAAFLRRLRSRFSGAWEPTLAAYNAGESRVLAAWEKAGRREGPLFVESLELPETWDYVHRVMLLAEGYRALYWPEARPLAP